jgi:hypothetical protein
MTTFWALTAATMSCGCGALFALVTSTSRLSVPQLVGLQHSEFAPTAIACDLLRQHRFVAQRPALAASGSRPLSRSTAPTAKRRRIIVT